MKNKIGIFFIVLISASVNIRLQTTYYSPKPLAHHGGKTLTAYPFGYATIKKMTYQQIHGDFPSKILVISKLAWRPYKTCRAFNSFSATMTLTVSQDGPNPDNATNDFAKNLGKNPKIIFTNKTIYFPSYTPVPSPAPFIFEIPFGAPYIYKGKKVFCWELRLHNHTNKSYIFFDLFSQRSTPEFYSGGVGCRASTGASPCSLDGSYGGGFVTFNGKYLPQNKTVFLLFGVKNTMWQGIVLPFDLSPLGAPCALRESIENMFPGTSDQKGNVTWKFNFTGSLPSGAAGFFQILALDQNANSLGIVLSNGLCWLWPYKSRPVVRIWQRNDDKAKTGVLQTTFGLIIKVSL